MYALDPDEGKSDDPQEEGNRLDYDYFGPIRYHTGDANLFIWQRTFQKLSRSHPPAAIVAVVPP